MKGPGLRIENDVRRVWECPRCGRRDRSDGAVTLVRCRCSDEALMRLVEGRRERRRFDVTPFQSAEPAVAAGPIEAECAPASSTASADAPPLATPGGDDALQPTGRQSPDAADRAETG